MHAYYVGRGGRTNLRVFRHKRGISFEILLLSVVKFIAAILRTLVWIADEFIVDAWFPATGLDTLRFPFHHKCGGSPFEGRIFESVIDFFLLFND